LDVRHALERRFAREGRYRARRWSVTVVVILVLAGSGFWSWFFVQYRTMAWWGAPAQIPYCGWNYIPVPAADQDVGRLSSMGPLVEVTSVPPLFRAVYGTAESMRLGMNDNGTTTSSCADPLYFQTGSGKLIEYAAPTV
jgi:hypothetical protein